MPSQQPTRRYRKHLTNEQQRRTMRIVNAWRSAIVEARRDEDEGSPGDYVAKTKKMAADHDLWNEFGYLAVNKDLYISDILNHIVSEGIEYIVRGEPE